MGLLVYALACNGQGVLLVVMALCAQAVFVCVYRQRCCILQLTFRQLII